jgi:hypothetical protein
VNREVRTILIFQELCSRAGDEERVLTALRMRAAAMIRNGQADAVLVCQRADLPRQLLCIQHHAGPNAPAIDGEDSPRSLDPGLVESEGRPARVDFLDGTYQFPLPPCRVWGVETCDHDVTRTLLKVSRQTTADPRICGVSVYRRAEDPSRTIAFLALAPEAAPGDYLELAGRRSDTELMLYPLRVSWTLGRLTSGTSPSPPLVRYPRAAFWARLGLVSGVRDDHGFSGPDPGCAPPPGEPRTSLLGLRYVVTCAQCGQTWQRASVVEGQTTACIFCGQLGHLSIGAPLASAPGVAPRVEAWLLY